MCASVRTNVKCKRDTCVSVVLCVVLVLCSCQRVVGGESQQNDGETTLREQGVCSNIDIRNNVDEFRWLKGCRVVEGFVQILLMDKTSEQQFVGIEFPELREITGYLLFYRANGVQSIGKLFPNLAVIRGNTLVNNYALAAYEMLHLQEIGLHSLTDITRGSVRFEKNPMLCFVDTIDWDLIAKAGKGGHFIKSNRQQNECPMCNESCPHTGLVTKEHEKKKLCWNKHHCQKVCPGCAGACDANGVCCSDNCLGGCTLIRKDGTPRPEEKCFVCKDILFGNNCLKGCPSDYYVLMKRRCVNETQCYATHNDKLDNGEQKTRWKPFNGTCILHCPPGYEEKMIGNQSRCEICAGPCRRECKGTNINSIASAQMMQGCTHIKGALEIQIAGGKNVVKELEENLKMIEEIDDYLKVVRSFPIVSLDFLKNLRVIHGKDLDSSRHALIVLDNQNIQSLWDWEARGNKKLSIRKGRLFFHFNPKLCISKIENLNTVLKLSPYTDLEVAPTSNGDKVPCNISKLEASVVWGSTVAIISWEIYKHHDERSLLGFVIYSMESPYNNLTLYDGRDACGSDGWTVDDAQPSTTSQILSKLKPYTQYAYYVKTYMISTERSGAQSDIKYFMTDADVPSAPQALKVYSNSSTDLVIKWQPPLTPNGNVTHYIVTVTKVNESRTEDRNYCTEPLERAEQQPVRVDIEDKTTPSSCACEEKSVTELQQEEEKLSSINFENTLQNFAYVRRPDKETRRRRSTDNSVPSGNGSLDGVVLQQVVYNSTVVVFSNLHHYGQYMVQVKACREMTEKERANGSYTTNNCSSTSFDSARTLSLEGADSIGMVKVEMSTNTSDSVKLEWSEPPRPNGVILAYQIEYQRVDIENHTPMLQCITRTLYIKNQNSYLIVHLRPGNHSVRIRTTSQAGYGNYTPKYYFLITESSQSTYVEWLVGGLVGCCVVFALVLAAYYVRRKYAPPIPSNRLIASVNPEYMSTVYVPDEWEVPRKKVELLRELGQGSFGMVYEGIGRDIVDGQPEIRCAIKTVGENASDRERSEFLNEASVMKAFHTNHVVRLLGVVSQGQPVLVVMELMTNGDLKTYLRSHRPDTGGDPTVQPPTLKRILQMAIEIADGMAYLAAKKFVHRDLAARNCMVAEDLTVKIGDFGMTRDIYETDYYRKGTKGLLPVRWMAPESLKDGVFTSRSDVWSYGVVLWEMATLASQPYQGLSNDQVLRYVIDAGVMERPENCPDRLYELMRLCWQHKPQGRPHFLALVDILLADVGPEFSRLSFYHSTEGCDTRAHLVNSVVDDDPATPLRVTRDTDDFSLGDSDDDEAFEVTAHSSSHYPIYVSNPPLLPISEPITITTSNGSKLGNGSTVNSPTAANGWIANHSNGTDPSLKTTEC